MAATYIDGVFTYETRRTRLAREIKLRGSIASVPMPYRFYEAKDLTSTLR